MFTPSQRRYAKARYKHYHSSTPAIVAVSPAETRHELLARAQRVMDLVRVRRGGHPHAYGPWERRAKLSEVAILRAAAQSHAPAPHDDLVWYVTIKDGSDYGLLYGPLATQMAALKALPQVRATAHDVNASQAAFASFGTASLPAAMRRPGLLNDYLSPLPALPDSLAAAA